MLFIQLSNVSSGCFELVNVNNVDHFEEYGPPEARKTGVHFSGGRNITVLETIKTIDAKIDIAIDMAKKTH